MTLELIHDQDAMLKEIGWSRDKMQWLLIKLLNDYQNLCIPLIEQENVGINRFMLLENNFLIHRVVHHITYETPDAEVKNRLDFLVNAVKSVLRKQGIEI